MVEQRPFKPLVPGSNPGALSDILRGNSTSASILGFKLREGGSIPSSPASVAASGEWCSGNTLDSKPSNGGSIPSSPA
jgi:hypothetical protein